MLSSALQITGIAALSVGAFFLGPAWGFIVTGILLTVVGISLEGK
jgi:hypothetical protein